LVKFKTVLLEKQDLLLDFPLNSVSTAECSNSVDRKWCRVSNNPCASHRTNRLTKMKFLKTCASCSLSWMRNIRVFLNE